MTERERLIKDGYVPVDLKSGNVQVGDSIVNANMVFGKLVKITKKGNCKVQFDMDYMDEKPTKFTSSEFEDFFLVKQKNMKPTIKQLVQETAGMNPVQFEAHCEINGIQTEWLEVCVSDFNYGFYNVTLPDYNDANVFASDGSVVEIDM